MSRPKYFWFGHIQKSISNLPELKQSTTVQAHIAVLGISEAIVETAAKVDGADRLKLIQMVYIDKSNTIEGAAMKIHISNRTAQRWSKDFIYLCARKMGYL